MKCPECNAELIRAITPHMLTCPRGHGKLVYDGGGDKRPRRDTARRNWLNSLPEAWRLGSCTIYRISHGVYRISGRDEPYICEWHEPATEYTPLREGEVIARIEAGSTYARRFAPIKLSNCQMKRLGFTKKLFCVMAG
jgi:hypothetical protein